jgi:hypothetical protein
LDQTESISNPANREPSPVERRNQMNRTERSFEKQSAPIAVPVALWIHPRSLRGSGALLTGSDHRVSLLRRCIFATLASLGVSVVSLLFTVAPVLAAAKSVTSSFGSAGAGPGQFSNPLGVATNDLSGDVYVVDSGNDRVQKFTASGVFIAEFGSEGAGAGQLRVPQGIAVEQITGDVYVTDQGNRRVDEFSEAGAFLRAFGWGVQNGAAELQVCTSACQVGLAGEGAGQFGEAIGYPAVEEAGSHDVYVADPANRRIDVFTPSGAFVHAFGWGVADGANRLEICTSPCYAARAGSGAGEFAAGSPTQVAVDSSGYAYALDAGNGRVQKFNPLGAAVAVFASAYLSGSLAPGGSPGSIAIEPVLGDVLVVKSPPGSSGLLHKENAHKELIPEEQVLEFDAVGDFLANYGEGVNLPGAGGLAVASSSGSGDLYYSTPDRVLVLSGTSLPAPGAEVQPASGIGSGEATLHGTADPNETPPNGIETAYTFEYSADGVHWETAPAAKLPAGTSPIPVAATIGGLLPNTLYEVRLVAEREFGAGMTTSSVGSFTTTTAPPTVDAESFAGVTATEANVSAQVDPGGAPTGYRVEYGTSSVEEHSTAEADAGSASTPSEVFASLGELAPDTLYRFRFVAKNARGVTLGAEATFTTAPTLVTGAESCPNAALRVGFSAGLPDCRAYELVTSKEPEIINYDPEQREDTAEGSGPGETRGVWASVTGERLAFPSNEPPAGSPSDGIYFMATRGADGWSTQDLIPPQSPEYGLICKNGATFAFTPDLSSAILGDGFGQPGSGTEVFEGVGGACGTDEPPLVPGEPRGYQNLFLQDNESGSHQLVDVTPAGVPPRNAWFQAASADLSHVVFSERAALVPGAPAEEGAENPYEDLYEWSGGIVRLVTFLPDGEPVEGALANATQELPPSVHGDGDQVGGSATFTHAVSADGSRVFFLAGGDLYVREHADQEQSPLDGEGRCADPAKACTVQVDGSQAGGSGGGGQFMWANAAGSLVYFTDEASAGLTADTVAGSGTNLYQFDVETGALTDLTPAGQAAVKGVSGASEDGSYIYFVAEGALTGPAEENSEGAHAEPGQPNLYVVHDAGRPVFVATLAGGDAADWKNRPEGAINPPRLTARVSPNGEFIGFNSVRSLTGYDNVSVESGCGGGACTEIFLYDAAQNRLSCVSCNPSGARPMAPSGFLAPDEISFGGLDASAPDYLQRNVLDDGRVLFDTAEALVPQDTNDQYDVYEYEGGQLHLLSTGTIDAASYFYEASLSGRDVFILAAQQLPSGKPEAAYSVYDVREGGGFPEPAGLTECSEEDCKGAFNASPALTAPSSATFSGAGNLSVAPLAHKPAKRVKRKPKQHKSKQKRHDAKSKHREKGGGSRAKRSIRGKRGGVR